MIDKLRAALQNANVRAFLRLLRYTEGTGQTERAYRVLFGGGTFDGFEDHPRKALTYKLGQSSITSTAAGAYQVLSRTWDECKQALGLPDFGPDSQDLAAVFLIHRRKALDDLIAGDLEAAIEKCNREWASLPGSPYGQPVKSLSECRSVYQAHGGTINAPALSAAPEGAPLTVGDGVGAPIPPGEAPDWPKEKPMSPIIAAVLPTLIEQIPKLGRIFGSGSEVADRNIKAAEVVVEAVKTATNAVNAQDAVEKVQKSPEARAAAEKAVEAIWYELTEAGGGGIDGARKADAQMRKAGDLLQSASFWIALLLLPLVYLLVLSLIGLVGSATWSDDVRAGLAGSLISAIVGGLVGYYYGTTTSRNRPSGA